MKELVRQRLQEEVNQQGLEEDEPGPEREEQVPEPAEADGELVWKQLRDEVLQSAAGEATNQVHEGVESEHG